MLDCIREDTKYETIRIEEPDLFNYKPLPIVQFAMPTMSKKTIIRKNKNLQLDKGKVDGFSLKKFFWSDDHAFTDPKLNKLKKRKVFISKPRLKMILDERKKKSFLNQMVFYDRYNDLLVFEGPSNKSPESNCELLISILFAILDYNRIVAREDEQQFLCFFEPLLEKQATIAWMQQSVRAGLFRKRLQKLPIYLIIRKRAALCI